LKYADFLNSKPDATVRDFCRKFSIKKADAVSILKSLECSGIKHSIFEVVSK
jgi:DNA-binding MarR family transcriptional regulator